MPSTEPARASHFDPSPAPKRLSKGEARKRGIVEAATRMLARNGARGTTLGEIAAAVGVSQAAVVYHFGTKEELLHAVLDNRDRFEDEQLWKNGPNPGLEIFTIVADIVESWATHPEIVGLLAVLLAENVGDDDLLRPRLQGNYGLTVDRLTATLRGAQDRGEMRRDIDAHLKAIEILAFLSGLELAWLVTPDLPAGETARHWARQQLAAVRTTTPADPGRED